MHTSAKTKLQLQHGGMMACRRRTLKKTIKQPQQNTKSGYCCVVNKRYQDVRWCTVCREPQLRWVYLIFSDTWRCWYLTLKSDSQKKMNVINVDCKHQGFWWSLRTSESFGATVTFSKPKGDIMKTHTHNPQQDCWKAFLGRQKTTWCMNGWRRLAGSHNTKLKQC